MSQIENKILELRSELKTDRLDMSFGEIMNIYEDGDLIITPEYQRSYRWKDEQKTKFIESILLGIPIPPIFVAEDDDGKWELVDGLQRISTILSFFGLLLNDKEKNNFKLTQTDLTNNLLVGISIKELPLKLKITLKRAVCRVEILRWDSKFDMRYELFSRLNTGSSPLKAQEIRNAVFIGKFNTLLKELAFLNNFINIVEPRGNKNLKYKEEMYFEELVLRYFSIIFGNLNVDSNISVYLDKFMKKVYLNEIKFDFEIEKNKFISIIDLIDKEFDENIFRGANNRFSENFYETVMYLIYNNLESFQKTPIDCKKKIDEIKENEEYKKASSFQTHQKSRLTRKFDIAREIFDV